VPTRRDVIDSGARELESVGVESARLESERLTAHALGVSRDRLALTGDEPLTPGQATAIKDLLVRRKSGQPLQHIEGTVQFRDLVLLSDRRALIPRPETEQLVEQVINWARHRRRRSATTDEFGGDCLLNTILDIGTGSGAIALALVSEGTAAYGVGLDISVAALEQARENRARAGLTDELELRSCGANPYEALFPVESFDAIISNPPYITEGDLEGLAAEVRLHDPRSALAGGADGLDVVRTIVQGAHERLRAGGALFLEIGAEQGDAVREILQSSAPWAVIEIRRDLSDRDRFAVATV
jgi:release factor glutamine methyltransferase